MTLDFVAARAVARARLLERAVHDPGPWTVQIAGVSAPAVKVLTAKRVIFLAYFDGLDWVGPAPDVAWLACEGVTLTSMDIDIALGRAFNVEWEIAVAETVGV